MVLLPGEDGSGPGPCCLSKGCCVLTNTGFFCSRAVGVLGFYQKFLFLIRLFSILKANGPFMIQGGKPEQSLILHRGGSCFCPEVQGTSVSPWHSWDERLIPPNPWLIPGGGWWAECEGASLALARLTWVQFWLLCLTWERGNCSMAVPAWELGCGLTGVNLAQMPEIGVWSWAPPGGLPLRLHRQDQSCAVLLHAFVCAGRRQHSLPVLTGNRI